MGNANLVMAGVLLLVHLAVIARAILLDGREPYARAAWVLLLVLVPVGGVALYLLFGEPRMSMRIRKRAGVANREIEAAHRIAAGDDRLDEIPDHCRNAFRISERIAGWPVAPSNGATLAPDSDGAIAMMIDDIDRAQSTVHLSFYIWLTDTNGLKMVDAVCRAARRGVTCRIVADAIGSRTLIRSTWWRDMEAAGATMCASLKAPPLLSLFAGVRVDLRNHRKIAVIDGRVTYSGSQNCADAAFLPKKAFAPWVDIMIRYEGPVARQNQLIFASAWAIETGEDLVAVAETGAPAPVPGGFEAIAVGTGPLSPRGAMTDIFVAALASAERTVVISTPYFVPDPPLIAAIVACARRGVDLTIIFPHRNDSGPVGAISRAYYATLSGAGVRIFEYRGGLLHAKTLVVDSVMALVGSSNMDRRSLDLNFENNILFHSPALSAAIEQRQCEWLADSIEIRASDIAGRSIAKRLVQNMLTMVGPVF